MPYGGKNRQLNPIIDEVGEPARIDVGRSSTELSQRVAQRLSALGEMTGGIVHDYRNILSVVDSGLRLAESNLGDPDKVRTFIFGAREGIARGLQLTSQLLCFAQQGAIKTCAADVNSLLTTLAPFLRYGAGPSADIILELSPTIPDCKVDPSQFAAALLNLVVNARDAMPSGAGEVRIYTARYQIDPATSEPGLDGVYVRVRVQDNGSGMPDHVARRVFEPFFTTKGEKGTGIGVPQVRAFMHHIGGHTAVTSEPGRGTTVDLLFPAIKPGDHPSGADCPDALADLSAASADNVGGLFSSHSNH